MAGNGQRGDGEGFFSAWSRRKRASLREEAEAKAAEAEAAERVAQEAEALAALEPEVDEAYVAALPPVDEITDKTDLQAYMKRGVPEGLRNAAMRKMWLSNSLIRNHDDPAVDYAWDWNAPEGVPGAGEIVNRDNVSKMVDNLTNKKRPDTESADAVLADDGEPPDPDPDASAERTDAQQDGVLADADAVPDDPPPAPSPTRRSVEITGEVTGASARQDDESREARAQARIQDDPVLPSKRHGGALPD